MSTTTTNNGECRVVSTALAIAIICGFFTILPLNQERLVLPTIPVKTVKYVTFTVESTEVKYLNLTLDGRLQSIVVVGIRAGNPDLYGRSLHLNGLRVNLGKADDKYTNLAYGDLPDFRLTPGSVERLHVEAFGLVPMAKLPAKVAEEVRDDVAAGQGIVDIVLSGRLGRHDLDVNCERVVIDSTRSPAARVQEADCQVRIPSYSDDRYSRDLGEI